jgi:hypothetical protein
VTTLALALRQPETGVEATETLRGLVDAIVLTPNEGELRIELIGNLAAMLCSRPQQMRRGRQKPATSCSQVKLVAGACNQRYLQP